MKYSYKAARQFCYPSQYTLINASYPFATGGDNAQKNAIDAHIKLVNDAIPNDSTEYTIDDIKSKFNILKENEGFIEKNTNLIDPDVYMQILSW